MARKTSIRHLLNTTRVPTTAEADTVRQVIEESYGELSKLRNQVDAFRNKLSNLLAKCEIVEKRIKVHEAIVAPIRRLPQEVLSEIFLHCLPVRDRDFKTFPVKEAPLLLCRVCSYWRAIARRTRPLWCTLTISNPYSYDGGLGFSGETMAVTKWISESGSWPFSVKIESQRLHGDRKYYTADQYEDGIKQVFAAIDNSSYRWTSVTGVAPCGDINRFITLMNSGKAPLLQELNLTSNVYYENSQKLIMSNLQMRVISFHGMPFVPAFDGVNLVHLHTLHLSGAWGTGNSLSMDSFWECMTHCPNLHNLTLDIDMSMECQTPNHIVEHTHLKICTLNFKGVGDPGPSLDKMCFPVLRKLFISMSRWSRRDHWPHLAELLCRSRSLTELHISGLHMSDHNFLQCLRAAPHLVTLVVGRSSMTEEIFKALMVKRRRQCLCPRLELIEFGLCNEVPWQTVRDMIISRWGGLLTEDDDCSKRGPGQVLQRISWCTTSSEFRENMRGDLAFQQCLRDGLKAKANRIAG